MQSLMTEYGIDDRKDGKSTERLAEGLQLERKRLERKAQGAQLQHCLVLDFHTMEQGQQT